MSRERPRFRRDLEALPLEVNGESYVEVRDPTSGARFTFYDFEYRVALAFDGLPLATVIPWLKLSTGMELTQDQLTVFADKLAELGFLEAEPSDTPSPAASDLSDVANRAEVSHASVVEFAPEALARETEPELRNHPPMEDAAGSASSASAAAVEAPLPAPDRQASPPQASSAETVVPSKGGESVVVSPVVTSSYLPRSQRTPPPAPWATPRPILSPAPTTLGPSLTEQSSSRRRPWRPVVLFGSLGVMAAAAVVAIVVPFLLSPQTPFRPRVRVQVAAPATVLRFFDGVARLRPLPGSLLRFPAAGRVAHIVAAGTALVEGDVVATLEGAETKVLLDKLASQRERLAFARQMQEGMHQAGNVAEEERQSSKVESRNAKLEKTLRGLTEVAVVAVASGTVEEVLTAVGQEVEAKSPAVRLRGEGFRATFAFARPKISLARKLPFCRLAIDGDVLDCRLYDSTDDSQLDVDVSAVPSSLVDQPARLARARYDAAILVPVSAVVHSGSHDELWLVSPQSRLEPRSISIAEADADVAVVVQGLDPGDRIVVSGPPSLRPGLMVAAE